ncbi:hypothetical protein TSAR_009048 [Trichomalopsis sarcophagae]|uniref:Uncharacterized protein n=1 Tax=Trichomalopsis sarcophagae TaxID=543379 RepID=A0A232EN15_9HYME|nr:hypothetical protein TSAR_009048 [Trichomalopsis sarcophagae]
MASVLILPNSEKEQWSILQYFQLEEKIRQQVKLQEKMLELTLDKDFRKQLQPVKQRLAADIREVIPLGNPRQHLRRKMTKLIPEPTSRAIFTEKRLQ